VGKYCQTVDLLLPLLGTLRSCGTLDYFDAAATGAIRYGNGVLPYGDALERAYAVADPPYLSTPRHAIERLQAEPDHGSSGVQDWQYRANGGYWLFVVVEPGANNTAFRVLVRVDNTGAACRIVTVPYDSRDARVNGLFANPVSCP